MNDICFLELIVGVLLAPLIYGVLFLLFVGGVTVGWIDMRNRP